MIRIIPETLNACDACVSKAKFVIQAQDLEFDPRIEMFLCEEHIKELARQLNETLDPDITEKPA